MPEKLPHANYQITKFSDDDKVVIGQNIVNGLLAGIATFPTPPILPAALQTLVNTYSSALDASKEGSKEDRKAMAAARANLINAIRVDGLYVNQIVQNLVAAGSSYEDVATDIALSGFPLSIDPSPAGPLPGPMVKKYGSPNKGVLKYQLIKVPNARGYLVRLTDLTASDAPPIYITYSNTRIRIPGQISGHEYNASFATIGTNPARNFDVQIVIFCS